MFLPSFDLDNVNDDTLLLLSPAIPLIDNNSEEESVDSTTSSERNNLQESFLHGTQLAEENQENTPREAAPLLTQGTNDTVFALLGLRTTAATTKANSVLPLPNPYTKKRKAPPPQSNHDPPPPEQQHRNPLLPPQQQQPNWGQRPPQPRFVLDTTLNNETFIPRPPPMAPPNQRYHPPPAPNASPSWRNWKQPAEEEVVLGPSASLQQELQWQHPPPATANPYEGSVAYRMQQDMVAEGFEHAGLDARQLQVATNTQRGNNTTRYLNAQEAAVVKVFTTVREYGGPSMRPLLNIVSCWHDPHGPPDYDFYNICGGPKNPNSKFIINKMLVLCGMKWTRTDTGAALQPNTLTKYLQDAFSIWRKKGIRFDFMKDFNERGQFAGIIASEWERLRKIDSSFGTNPNQARIKCSFLEKFRAALHSGVLNPKEDAVHMLFCQLFIMGFYLGLRGKEEQAELRMDQYVTGKYDTDQGGDLVGLDYCGANLPWSKAVQLKISKTSRPVSDRTQITFCEDPEDPDFCPVKCTRAYIDKCHPLAKKFYASIATPSQRETYRKQYNRDIWFNPSGAGTSFADGTFKANTTFNLGHNMVSKNLKRLAQLIGCEDFHKASGHAFRALMITVSLNNNLSAMTIAGGARHASVNSQKSYATKAGQQEANRQFALNLDGKVKTRTNKKTTKAPKQKATPANDRKPSALSCVAPPRVSDYREAPANSVDGSSLSSPGHAVKESTIGASPRTAAEILKLEARKKKLELLRQVQELEAVTTTQAPETTTRYSPPTPFYPPPRAYYPPPVHSHGPPNGFHHRGPLPRSNELTPPHTAYPGFPTPPNSHRSAPYPYHPASYPPRAPSYRDYHHGGGSH